MNSFNRMNGGEPGDEERFQAEDDALHASIQDLLNQLPADIREALNAKEISIHDPGFQEGLFDHIRRLAVADPAMGRSLSKKIQDVKRRIVASLKEIDPTVKTSETVKRSVARVGRNDKCPCGSGKKYKQCCLRKHS